MAYLRDYHYQSVLAPYIQDYISIKRKLGYIYNSKSYQLYRLDHYWIENGYNDPHLTSQRLEKWISALPNERKNSQQNRIRAAKSLAVYLNTIGIKCDIPSINIGKDYPQIHILDKTELKELFAVIDSYVPIKSNPMNLRLADEYPIIFRFYYCCGMRNNEVCSLKSNDIDLINGIIKVHNGKNNKERLVYLAEDLRILVNNYFTKLKANLGYEPYWFFPGRNPDKQIPKTSIDKKFSQFWYMTASSKHCDKKPTPHSLRHGFVVDRINKWIIDGVDINVMLTYLSKYLGHNGPDDSFYYYHLVMGAFNIIKQKDTISDYVFPEIRRR